MEMLKNTVVMAGVSEFKSLNMCTVCMFYFNGSLVHSGVVEAKTYYRVSLKFASDL